MDNAVREAMFDYNVKVREKDEAGNLTNEMNAFMNQQMEEAKAYSRESLKCSGNEDVPIYCISNYFPDRYEFSKLILDIVAHLLEAQRQVLTFSRNIFSNEALMAKEKILKKQTKYHAALSGLIAAVPTPGVNLLLDVPLIVNTLTSIDQDIEKDYEINPDSPFLKKKYKKISNSIFYC